MADVAFQIADDLQYRLSATGNATDAVRLAAAFSLCERGELSTSQASRLAGLSYAHFLEAAARAKVALFSIDSEELNEEISRGFTMGRQRVTDHLVGKSGTT